MQLGFKVRSFVLELKSPTKRGSLGSSPRGVMASDLTFAGTAQSLRAEVPGQTALHHALALPLPNPNRHPMQAKLAVKGMTSLGPLRATFFALNYFDPSG